jgi:hypothetical protein
MTVTDALARGRIAYDRQAWSEAYTLLAAASKDAPLEPEDIVRQATAAALTGRDDEASELRARAY